MTPLLDADFVLTTLYCLIDDALKQVPQARPVRPGPAWTVSDSEVLTLAVLRQCLPHLSERAWLRSVAQRFPGAFPRLPSQSSDNRQLQDLWGVLAWLGSALARQAQTLLPHGPLYAAVDGTGVSLLALRRGRRGCTYGDGAGRGRGGVDRQWFYQRIPEGLMRCSSALLKRADARNRRTANGIGGGGRVRCPSPEMKFAVWDQAGGREL